MTVILKNNAVSTLTTAISASDTGIVVASGAQFPALSAGEYFYATLVSPAGTTEIVKVTARASNSLTVVRAQDGSSAASFQVGALVEMRVNAASVRELRDEASEISIADAGNYYTATNVEGALQEVGADLREQAAQERNTVAALLADTILTYTAGQAGTVVAGTIVRTRKEGFSYEVAASGASNHHVTTAGGVKLYVLPSADDSLNVLQFGAVGDGVTDCWPAFHAACNLPVRTESIYSYARKVIVPVPDVGYYLSDTLQLKHTVELVGNGGSGMEISMPVPLRFAADKTGIIVHRADTIDDTTQSPATTGAFAAIIRGLTLIGSGSDTSAHGIWLRARSVVEEVRILDFPGNGLHIVANSGGTPQGNANLWRATNLRITGCGENGVFVDGADANAGIGTGIDCSLNKLWGIWDSSFLGNTWVGCHVEANGSDVANGKSAFARFGGQTYHAVPGTTLAQLVATQPGTDNTIWRPCINAPSIAWTGANAEGTFRQGGGVYSDNPNARCTFIGLYVEGGQGLTWLSQHSIALGGFLLEAPVSSGAAIEGRFGSAFGPGFASEGTHPASGRFVSAALGGDPNVKQMLILSATDANGANPTGTWRLQGVPGSDALVFRHSDLDARTAFVVSGPSATNPYRFGLSRMDLGSGLTIRQFGRIDYSDSPGVVLPTSGNYTRGDLLLAPNPNAGGKVGFVCTVSGVAGSTAVFKEFGAIDP